MASTLAVTEIPAPIQSQNLIADRAQDLARFYRGLGDPTRLRSLKLLSTGVDLLSPSVEGEASTIL